MRDKPHPEDFDNPDVLNAVNPHPEWGYVHVAPNRLRSLHKEASRASENAMKRWILTRGWRDVLYHHEPGWCYPASPIGRMYDEVEEISANNPTFAKSGGLASIADTLEAIGATEPLFNPEHNDSDVPKEENNTADVTKRIEVIDLTE
ncbi:unnamed protein product [Penicillium glandicola]